MIIFGTGKSTQLLEQSNFETARGSIERSNCAGLGVPPYYSSGVARMLVGYTTAFFPPHLGAGEAPYP